MSWSGYDINLSEDVPGSSGYDLFREPPVDEVFEGDFVHGADDAVFSVEYLPGQFDQRVDLPAVREAVKETEEPVIKTATTYVISGSLKRKSWTPLRPRHQLGGLREASLKRSRKLWYPYLKSRRMWAVFEGFASMDEAALKELYGSLNLAMTFKDFPSYPGFLKKRREEGSVCAEIRVLDTYWSGPLPPHPFSHRA